MVQLDTVTPVAADAAVAETPAAPVKDAAQTETLTEAAAALDLLAAGRRHLVVGEVQQAVQSLQESCAKLAAQYGETGDECGEAYLVYGTALLELGRMESGVLGNALAGAHADSEDEEAGAEDSLVEKDEEMSEEKREELSEEVLDAMTEERTPATDKPEEEEKKEEGEAAKEEGAEEKEDEETKEEEVKESEAEVKEGEAEVKEGEEEVKEGEEKENGEEEVEAGEEENGEEEDEGVEEDMEEGAEEGGEEADRTADEDVSNLQLAWEVLELAKLIFLRQQDDEKAALKAAEAHLRLGEVGLETEQAAQAAEDFAACLALQLKHLPADSRLVAETHYQLGVALAQTGKFDESLTSLRAAVDVLQARVAAADADAKEVEELKALLPDILNKIEDTEEEKRATEKAKSTLKEALTGAMAAMESESVGFGEACSSSSAPSAAGDAPVADITEIVRKKRKNDEDTSPEAKKVKTAEEEAAPAEEVSSTTA